MGKRQVYFTIDEDIIKEMEEIREKTGMPVSTQIELKLKGYEIRKREEIISPPTPESKQSKKD